MTDQLQRRATTVRVVHHVDDDQLNALRTARSDLLIEEDLGGGQFGIVEGPFYHYHRSLTIQAASHRAEPSATSGTSPDAGAHAVTEVFQYRLAIPIWGFVLGPLMKRALSDLDRSPRSRWWWTSADVMSAQTSVLLSVVSVIAALSGYLGVLIGQTLTFAAEEFDIGDAGQGRTLAAVRIGVLVSVLFIRWGDRIGRRPLLIAFSTAATIITALGAVAPNLVALGVTQAVARGLTTGLITLVALTVAEEVPASSRSMTIGLFTLATGLGAGAVVWVLPLADLGVRAWRLLYLVPLLALPMVWWAWRSLPETRRFSAADESQAPAVVDRRRFAIIAGSGFAAAIFLSPASQFLNEYLREELSYSAGRISVFRLAVNTPIAVFVLGAGVLADRIGRRPVGAVGIVVGTGATALMYFSSGTALWITAMAGSWLTAGAFTALRSYQTELFPTKARARVGGWIDVITVTGSAIGLLFVGELAERVGSLGPPLAFLLLGPVVAVFLIVTAFPETAGQELEVFNPTDPAQDPLSGGS